MAMSNQEKEKERLDVSGFCEAICSTAEFECSLEDILDKKAAEAKWPVWKMEIKRENKEEKRLEKDESMDREEKGSENDESMIIKEKRSEKDESMNIEEKKPEVGVDISTEERRELIITKIHQQRIGENPLKNAVGHVNKDPVQNSESKRPINDKETTKDENKRKREMKKYEKLLEKKAKEEEKNVKAQYKAIDKSIKKHSKDIKSTMKKEEKRKAQIKKMGEKAQRMLEKEMRKIEKERLKDEKKKLVHAIDAVQEKQNDLKIVNTNETENDEDENKKIDPTINVDGETQNGSEKTQKEAGLIKEEKNNYDDIEKNERKENDKKDAKVIEMSTNNAGKKTTFVARISGFFRSLSCIKRQKKSNDVCQ